MSQPRAPLILVNAVGLTPRLLPLAPHLHALAQRGWVRSLIEPMPAVTCTSQATILTGQSPERHGIVANGWLFRESGEVRFWQQSNRLLQAEPLYVTAKRRDASLRCAKLFWWFNQGAEVDFSVTPKPYYGADGNKAFGITGRPEGLTKRLEQKLGPFPFASFWGPKAGLACTQWIATCASLIVEEERPDLTLVYLPHLDYDPQRFGPSGSDLPRLVRELDEAFALVADAAAVVGGRVWVVSEYGHCDVRRPVFLNRALRQAGLLTVRRGPFGENLETFESQAFAVCDHQLAHVYLNNATLLPKVREALLGTPGVRKVICGEQRHELQLNHPRAGDLIVLAEHDAWFAYPFWLDDRHAPDYARTVDIHRKPGFDPCELFLDPQLSWPTGRFLRRLIQKRLGFRTLFDVIPLDAGLVRGSHGLPASSPEDGPLLIGDGPAPEEGRPPMQAVRDLLLQALIQA